MKTIAKRVLQIAPSLTLAITAKGKKMKEEGIDVVSFGAGEPDFNTPDFIINAAKEALDKGVTKYTPASGTVELRKAIAAKLKKENGLEYDFSQIVVSNGAKHSLHNALLAVVESGDEVIIPAPYWLTYPELVTLAGGKPVYIETDADKSFKMTPNDLEKAITSKTKAIIFNNPSNPTGTVYTKDEIYALAAVIEKHDLFVISDEIYEKLTYDFEPFSIAACSQKLYENTILVNGMSKTFSMTGWRVGYTASSKPLAQAMGNMQSHTTSNANSIAQYATAKALNDPQSDEFVSQMKQMFVKRLALMTSTLKNMQPLTYVYPQGAFYVMVGMENLVGKKCGDVTIKSASDFASLLVDKAQVVTIPCESFGAPMHIRLSYAIHEDNIVKGLDRIKTFVASL